MVLFLVIGLGLMVSIMIGGGSVGMSGLSNSVNSVMTTTYLSQDTVLSEVNQEFSSMEYDLQSQIESIKTDHPGYDEYIINKKEKLVIIPMNFYPIYFKMCGGSKISI